MRATQPHCLLIKTLAVPPILLLLLLMPAASAAPKFKVLHAFGQGHDGAGTWRVAHSSRPLA